MTFIRPAWLTAELVRILALIVGALVLLLLLVSGIKGCMAPKTDPALGRALQGSVTARATVAQKTIEQAAPVLRARIMAPSHANSERIKPYVAKITTAAEAAPPAAVHIADDDFYRSLCDPGGVYARRPDCDRPRREYSRRSKRGGEDAVRGGSVGPPT